MANFADSICKMRNSPDGDWRILHGHAHHAACRNPQL